MSQVGSVDEGAARTATPARLEKLLALLVENKDSYYRALSRGSDGPRRIFRWIDEYNAARWTPAWDEFCAKHQLDRRHTALDTLA